MKRIIVPKLYVTNNSKNELFFQNELMKNML